MHLTLSPAGRALVVTGAALFLVGVAQGAVVDLHANPRVALSAHLDAVQSGMAVMLAGLLWHAAGLTARAEAFARWTLAIGMVGLWLGITLAAITGASEALPMAGEGHSARPTTEGTVTMVILASSASLAAGWAMFVWGLVRNQSNVRS
ncbi:hypothetical protein [Alteriqipengyuania sp. 357]